METTRSALEDSISAELRRIYDNLPPDDIVRFLPDFEFGANPYEWEDPVWGKTKIDESWGGLDEQDPNIDYTEMFMRLSVHPAVRRLGGVEQLTLPEHYATLRNAAQFSRLEHVMGSALVTKLLIDKWNEENPEDRIDNHQKTIFMLRTMLSDLGHTIGSHLGDWIESDVTETKHDQELLEYIRKNGIGDIISQYEITLEEVILTEVEERDFVERSSPSLCIDRVDYAVREIHRINRYFDDPEKKFTIDDFRLVKDEDGKLQLVMNDPNRALLFAKAYELLPKEDWSEPLQRLQTTLYTDLVKTVLVGIGTGRLSTVMSKFDLPLPGPEGEETWVFESNRHPRDILMHVESIIEDVVVEAGSYSGEGLLYRTISEIDTIMRTISSIAQEYNRSEREAEVVAFMDAVENGDVSVNAQIPDRSILTQGITGSLGSGDTIEISFHEDAELIQDESCETVLIELPRRKKRGIDPPIPIDGKMVRLSELPNSEYALNDGAYNKLVAQIRFDTYDWARSIKRAKALIEPYWDNLQKRPRISAEQLREEQQHALIAFYAVGDYPKFTRDGVLQNRFKKQERTRIAALFAGRRCANREGN